MWIIHELEPIIDVWCGIFYAVDTAQVDGSFKINLMVRRRICAISFFSYIYAVRGGMLYELRAKEVEEDLKRKEITSYASLRRHFPKCISRPGCTIQWIVLAGYFCNNWIVCSFTTTLQFTIVNWICSFEKFELWWFDSMCGGCIDFTHWCSHRS